MDNDVKFTEELLNLIKEGGSHERIYEILQESCLYDLSDASGKTILHYSALYNNVDLTENLLNDGFNPNAQDLIGNTPLMIATMQEHYYVIQDLIASGADIFKVNNENKSALNMVGELHIIHRCTLRMFFKELQIKCSTNEEMVKELMDAGCHLYQAAVLTDAKILEGMLKQGCSVDSAHPGSSRETTLLLAAKFNDLDSVNLLLRYGANVNALDYYNQNPLFNMYRSIRNSETEHNCKKLEILKVILNKGASMTTCASSGLFQVSNILHEGTHKEIRVLLESGLDFDEKDRTGETVLHYLASNSNPGLDTELKPYVDKFDVNVVNRSGMTPLLIAVVKGNVDMVKFFLKQGANPNAKFCIRNTTPLYYAYGYPDPKQKYQKCIQLLLEYDADPQIIIINRQNQETIFDIALRNEELNKIKPVIDYLAIIEKRGTLITETTKTVINSNVHLKTYFDQCREIIAEKISGNLVLFDLLISDERKMARYLENDEIIHKLRDDGYFKHKIKQHNYYHDVLYKRYSKANRYRKLKNKAALVISELLQKRVNNAHLVVDNIIVHLDDRSLQQLSLLYYQLSHR